VAINNHRTQRPDLDLFIEEVIKTGQEVREEENTPTP
jgi:hypothetical protein